MAVVAGFPAVLKEPVTRCPACGYRPFSPIRNVTVEMDGEAMAEFVAMTTLGGMSSALERIGASRKPKRTEALRPEDV